jgi:hypothetical protein
MSEDLFYTLLYGWIALAIIVFPVLFKIPAPYGRYTRGNWGPTIPNRWGWFFMEVPVLFFFSWFYFTGTAEKTLPVWIIYLAFMVHYFNRVFIFPFRIRDNGKRMPVSVVLMAVFFNFSNGFFNGYWFGTLSAGRYPDSWLYSPQFITGLLLFITGMYINISSDNILLSLRKGGKKGYFIPHGKLFKYVSSPNLLGEIIEWTGWAVMGWALPPASFAIWTFANLVPRAVDHHKWYHYYFVDYPKERKAIFPKIL